MKPNRKNLLLAALSFTLASQSAQATNYWYDNNGTTAGFGTAGGTWAAPTVSQWSTSNVGTATPGASITTTTADALTFGTGTASNGLGGGTITVSGTVDALSLTFGSQTTGNILITGGIINLAAAGAISVGAGSTTVMTIASQITGAGTSLTKSGNILALSGANNYSGATNITAGTLVYRNTGAKSASSTHTFSAGTTLGLGVATTGAFFTSTDIDNAFAGSMVGNLSNVVVAADTRVGIDTSSASFTYATSVAGSPGRGLTKLGGNILTLTGANTYTGSTSILGGTLRLENLSAVSGSTLVSIGSGTTLQIATDTAFSGPTLSLTTANIVSDRATTGAGITHVFGNVTGISNSSHNFTGGALVNDQNAGIQLGNIINASGSGGTCTLNPTTANLTIAGGYTGATNAGTNALTLSGTAATNSMTGDITLGTRTGISVTKSGNSVWTLSGNNSVSLGVGSTLNVTGGALIVTTAAALPGTATVTFGGGVIGAQVGGAGLTTAELDGFLAAGSTVKTSGAIGIDTSNGNLTQWTDFTTTNLGPALGLAKLGTNTLTLNSAANNYTGTTLVSQGTLEMTVDHTLTGGLTLGYANGTTSATGTLDLNAVNATFGALNVDGNSSTPYGIQVDATKTLTTNGAVVIGAPTPGVNRTVTKLNMTGGGAYVHNGTTFLVGGNAAAVGLLSDATLDLRGLSSTTITTSGNFRVAPNNGTNNGSSATMFLPTPVVADTVATTTITSNGTNGISVGNSGAFSASSTLIDSLQLGTGLTRLNGVKVNVGAEQVSGNLRDIGQLIFGQAAGDLIIRGADGISAVTSINLGTGTASTGAISPSPTLFDSSGHDADILATTLNVGGYIRTTGAQTYQFKFGEGDNSLTGGFSSKLDVTDVNIGSRIAGTTSIHASTSKLDISGGSVVLGNMGATGTGVDLGNSAYDQLGVSSFNAELNISGGTTTIHNGTGGFAVRLGQSTSAVVGGTVNASMNLTGGTTTLTGDIVKGTATGTVNSTLKIAGGTLDMGGNDIGAAAAGAVTLTAESGTLSNVATINGTGGLTKTTANTLIVSGTIAYTGDTTVSDGTLRQSSVNAANEGSTVSIAATATLDLTYAGTDTVDKLFIDGVQQPMGVYGPTATAIPGRITNSSGTGTLTVATGPAGYSAWAGLNGASLTNLSEDHDSDGVDNGTEYFIGGPTGNTTGFTPLPGVTNTLGVLSVTWTKAAGYTGIYGTDFVVETSATLTGVWATEPSPGTVAIGATTVTYTFPAGTINFARLKVTGP